MKEYNYHNQYKYYTASSDAFESPVEPGSYLVSSCATLLDPPEVDENHIQIFNENSNSWEIIEDLRGTYYSIFDGSSFYNENPTVKPENCTDITPPNDYSPEKYIWNSEINYWEKLNEIYKISNKLIEDLTIEEKLEKLHIKPQELKKLLGIENFYNLPLEKKFEEIKINSGDLKNLLGIDKIINSDLIEKLNLLNIDIEEIKTILGITEIIENTLVELNLKIDRNVSLSTQQIKQLSELFNNAFSNIPNEYYIKPTDFSKIKILRPIEIIQTSEKFESDNEILNSLYIGICIDTGERKFGDSITPWNDLPSVEPNQKYRFSKILERWEIEDPIPGENIECYETDTGKIKIGNGFSAWSKLPYEGA
jgi:hypothetical protein